jgi:hypothetical protein
MSAYTNYGKTIRDGDSGLKSTLTERDLHTLGRIVASNDRTTAAQVSA